MNNKLEQIIETLKSRHQIEGVEESSEILELIQNEECENFYIIENDVFLLTYSKSYRSLKFVFGDCSEMDIEPETIGHLVIVNIFLKELEDALKELH